MEDWLLAFKELFAGIGVPDDEVLFFADRLLTLLTSCPERRVSEYEQIPWWTFIAAESHSAIYQTLLAKGLTRSLVAVRAQESSTRTAGYILLQLIFGILTWGGFDRLLSGPTSEVWLSPWIQYLSEKGVQFQPDTTIKAFQEQRQWDHQRHRRAGWPADRHLSRLLHRRLASRDHDRPNHQRDEGAGTLACTPR
jgi:uncharacterized protein with NAD-binding domain and iron-sulfur cluster